MSTETVLITGASSGIGRELARKFAADGSRLILVARRRPELEQLADELRRIHATESHVIPCDLADPESPQSLFDAVGERGLQVDILVNNAGFGQHGPFADISIERQLAMIRVNVSALVHLTHLFLRPMQARNKGAILNVGSTASFQPGPNCAVYYATKAFVLSFSEAISRELRGSGVRVTCLCPGPTRTGFGDDSGMHDTPVFRLNAMSVETVAAAAHRGLRRGKRLVMPGLLNNLLAASVRFTPRAVILDVMNLLQPIRKRS